MRAGIWDRMGGDDDVPIGEGMGDREDRNSIFCKKHLHRWNRIMESFNSGRKTTSHVPGAHGAKTRTGGRSMKERRKGGKASGSAWTRQFVTRERYKTGGRIGKLDDNKSTC